MRLFVAADLPAELRARLVALQHDLRGLRSEVRWVRLEGIHLTFVFLGEASAEQLLERFPQLVPHAERGTLGDIS